MSVTPPPFTTVVSQVTIISDNILTNTLFKSCHAAALNNALLYKFNMGLIRYPTVRMLYAVLYCNKIKPAIK